MEISFGRPEYLWLLIGLPMVVVLHYLTNRYAVKRALTFANFAALERVAKKPVISAHLFFLAMRLFTISAVIFALADVTVNYLGRTSDFDFVIAVDSSSSMLARDFEPNRLEAAKQGVASFLGSLSGNSKVGIVSFAGTSFIESFLTDDRDALLKAVDNLAVTPTGGTDMGEAIITGANMLLSSNRSRAIVLISDGESNVGVPVEEAVQYANRYNIAVHTIGIATEEGGVVEGVNITLRLDERSLRAIANETGATYTRATDIGGLLSAHKSLSAATADKRLSLKLNFGLVAVALAMLLLDWALVSTKYRIIP